MPPQSTSPNRTAAPLRRLGSARRGARIRVLVAGLLCVQLQAGFAAGVSRTTRGLVSLYDFQGTGNTVLDRAPGGRPLNLRISDMGAVRRTPGTLEVRRDVLITSDRKADKLNSAVRKSGAVTVEVWITPANRQMTGPSRIVSLSKNTSERNFTLAQEGDRFDLRFRSSKTDPNGLPSLPTPRGLVQTRRSHLVFTRDRAGRTRLYLNGGQVLERKLPGSTSAWNDGFRLSLANETGKDRPWRGSYHLVAVYDRELSGTEVAGNFRAGLPRRPVGATTRTPPPARNVRPPPASRVTENTPPVRPNPIDLPGGVTLPAVDFERHVVPLFSRQGCNAGSCHGSFSGASDFQLSLFGHDPKLDYGEIMNEDDGLRVEVDDVMQSLILRKPSGLRRHRGGKRFETNSWQFAVFERWIRDGAKRQPASGRLNGIRLEPEDHRFTGTNETVRLRVMAYFADDTREDVTAFCKFDTQDDNVADIDEDGVIRSVRPGDTAIIVSYRDETVSTRAYVPVPVHEGFAYPRIETVNYVDNLVLSKLRKLNILPSFHTTDGEFLRRIYIDTIGRLPEPDEARKFFLDQSPGKRDALIDRLLAHPDHAALWATKFSDITGNDTSRLYSPAEKRSQMWHDWLRLRFEKNVSYDELVRGILTASSREGRGESEWIRQAEQNDSSNLTGFDSDYAKRETLDLFWKRKNLKTEQVGERVAAAFLGVRLQCAQCHKHPYDRWTQRDYRGFAGLFGQVRVDNGGNRKTALGNENRRRKGIKDKKKKLPQLREVHVDPRNPRLMPDPVTRKGVPAAPLASDPVEGKGDYRRKLWDWMVDRENPLFAQNLVNRVWQHYFGIGIVEPVDDLSDANPPTNPHLLTALANDFAASDFDLRHIERRILRSRVYQFSSVPNRTNREDRKNFSRSFPRNLMAEVAVDVIQSAVGAWDNYRSDARPGSRAIEVAPSTVRDGDLRHAFQVFGRPTRAPVCTCERSPDPALPQTLHLMTDADLMHKIRNGRLKKLLTPARLDALRREGLPDGDIEFVIRELFLAALTRHPDRREMRAAMAAVKAHRNETGFTDVLWALLNTREFILNH